MAVNVEEFVIKIASSEDYGDCANTVRDTLTSHLPYHLTVFNVAPWRPENYTPHSKIQSIKRVRDLLGCSLRDAKFLVDAAQQTGAAEWDKVCVTLYGTNEFRVSDEDRPRDRT